MWAADGKKDILVRARDRVEELLAAHQPIPLPEERAQAVDAVVRDICERQGVNYETIAV
jgi:trimethylamine:corrinoid methyltransferase-like protein